MDLEYVSHEDLGTTPEVISTVINRWNHALDLDEEEVFRRFTAWWDRHGLPRGLQCVALHLHDSMNDFVVSQMVQAGLNVKNVYLKTFIALHIDAMIH